MQSSAFSLLLTLLSTLMKEALPSIKMSVNYHLLGITPHKMELFMENCVYRNNLLLKH
jgi:hypothetical protein